MNIVLSKRVHCCFFIFRMTEAITIIWCADDCLYNDFRIFRYIRKLRKFNMLKVEADGGDII